ncbi:MAG: hypothetical protein LBM27_05515 [Lactobacillaceae bacterium]|jgi:hypothetical protein|nr:hypothetical protein [Lactobacillaceae bacterium]
MQYHVTNTYGFSSLNAAKKAQNDIANAGRRIGFNEIPLFAYRDDNEAPESLNARMDGIIAPIRQGDIVFFQYNIGLNSQIYTEALIRKIKVYGGIPVLFVHDNHELLFGEDRLWPGTAQWYNEFGAVIAHTEQLKEIFIKSGVTVPIVSLGLFDYLRETDFDERPTFEKAVTVAGNIYKTPDTANWKQKTTMKVWSPVEDVKDFPNIQFMGSSDPETLPALINSGFGLVWYSDSPDDDPTVKVHYKSEYYSTVNSAHRLSLYLVSGIPLIVKSNLAQAQMIKENDIGIVIDSIEEIDEVMDNMTEERYNQLVDNVQKFKDLISTGFFSQRAFINATQAIKLKNI